MLRSTLGDTIGFNETLEEELKEFILKIDPIKYFDEDEIKNVVLTGKINKDRFNLMIADNINHYFKYYLPKYVSCFGNSKLSHANLYIGVNDFSEVTGIPFFGTLTSSFVESFADIIKSYISIPELSTRLKFEVIKLDIEKMYLDDNIDELMEDYKSRKLKFEEEYNKNLLERRAWIEKMDYYTTRIHDYANKKELRNLVINYIESSPEYNPEYTHVVELLKSSKEIPVGDGTEIAQRKFNKHDVIYWITEFKDTTIDKLKAERPNKLPYISYDGVHSTQFSLLTNLRYRFLNNNDDIHYYLIKISFPTNIESKIFFRNYDEDNWIMRTRSIVNGGPGCC